MLFWHGTSDALNVGKILLPAMTTNNLREEWRTSDCDKVFVTNSKKSAIYYAKKAAQKFGGNPIVYAVKPVGTVFPLHNAEFICDKAIII